MKISLYRASLLAGVVGAMTLSAPAAAEPKTVFFGRDAPAESNLIPNRYVCAFVPGSVAGANVRRRAAEAAGPLGGRVIRAYRHAFSGFLVHIPDQAVDALVARNPNIASCEQDQAVQLAPPDGRGPKSKGGDESPPPQLTPYGIEMVGGGAPYGGSAKAWVIDTGIDLDHPDLNVDTANSVDLVPDRGDSPEDLNGHGTHVAGTIAAIDNDLGVVGVAPGATVVAVRVLDRNGRGTCSDIAAGVDYVAGKWLSGDAGPGDVVNMSLGCPAFAKIDDAVLGAAALGLHFALAAGNDGADAESKSPARVNEPAGNWTGGRIVTIAARDSSGDFLTSWSNYGTAIVDWAEPGEAIESTWKNGGYNTISGTSMASPHAAGIMLRTGGIIADGGDIASSRDGATYDLGVVPGTP